MTHSSSNRGIGRLYALVSVVTLMSALSIGITPSALGQTTLSQCNGTDNVGGQAVECHYTVTNNLDGTTTSSSTTVTECHGAANDPATLVCTQNTTTSTQLVTTVDQCNGSGNGGGGTVLCTVDVINNITGSATATPATVNQCNDSGLEGGTEPTVLCDPFPANTTGADVTQCNVSGNGGGGTQRVRCTVDSDSTTTSVLDVTVNQCNGSGNGGGATVTCRTGMRTNITPAAEPTASPSPSSVPGSPTPGPGGSDSDGSSSDGSSSDGSSSDGSSSDGGASEGTPGGSIDNGGIARRSDSVTTGQVVRVPAGGVAAGGGSTSGLHRLGLLKIVLLLISAAAFGGVVGRLRLRRRSEPKAQRPDMGAHREQAGPPGRLIDGLLVGSLVVSFAFIAIAVTSRWTPPALASLARPTSGFPVSELWPGISEEPDFASRRLMPAVVPAPAHAVASVLPDAAPVSLDIEAIGVHSRLHDLGLDSAGAIEAPSGTRYDEAAWYRHSPMPGSLGPSIIVGHVDSASNGPSVFFRLEELTRGDRISVTRTDGSIALFTVQEIARYSKEDFPTERVYGNLDHAGLRLITCGGAFNDAIGHYEDNVVVFARLDASAS